MEIDLASLQDIDVFARDSGGESVFDSMNTCRTLRASQKLDTFLRNPLKSRGDILQMQESLTLICELGGQKTWPFPKGQIEEIEKYLLSNILMIEPNVVGLTAVNRLFFKLRHQSLSEVLNRYVRNLLESLSLAKELPLEIFSSSQGPLAEIAKSIGAFYAFRLSDGRTVEEMLSGWQKASPLALDWIFRRELKAEIKRLLGCLHELDMLCSLADFNFRNGLINPKLLPEGTLGLVVHDLRHLFLPHGQGNDIHLGADRSIIFLTGPNMAGKSTLLKSVALAVFLAHLGLGVPAKSMNFSLLGGMVTSITISDSLKLGNSYYMSEVKRVKEAALLARRVGSCLLLFDETFKGTNVKDASDATLALVQALSRFKHVMGFLSSHLHEVAEEFASITNVFPMKMEAKEGGMAFTYLLEEGVSKQRLGMRLLMEEGVFELLDSRVNEIPVAFPRALR